MIFVKFRKALLVQYIEVCTLCVPVHTHTDHTHTLFPIRQDLHCFSDHHKPPYAMAYAI